MKYQLTARQELERKGAFFYILSYSIMFITSLSLQLMAGLNFKEVLPSIVINSINLTLGFLVYRKKKKR